ncbi:ABC transporter permease [Nocardioides sp.]|uniref:ABC transporter permease n=1 Tax=Nocardioides sp. TaxID=35761 RepID=UPI0025E6480F|nr:ABC transporter permease [Nocardioides sp.]
MSAPVVAAPRRWMVRLPTHLDAQVIGVYVLLLALTVIVAYESPMFRTSDGLLGVYKQSAFFAILAVGQLVVMLGGGIDLSIGATAKLSAMATAMVMSGQDSRLPAAIGVAVLVGIVVGLTNAFIVLALKVPPFIATFGVYYILQGVVFSISTEPVGRVAPAMYDFYTAQILGIDAVNLAIVVFWIGVGLCFSHMVAIRRLYAVGGNEEAARLAGINVNRVRLGSYVACSVLASLAGMYLLMRSGVAGPTTGDGAELAVIAAVVIGGVSLMGGRGTVIGVFGGVLLMQVIVAAFDYLQINTFYQEVIRGLLILATVAVFVDRRSKA